MVISYAFLSIYVVGLFDKFSYNCHETSFAAERHANILSFHTLS